MLDLQTPVATLVLDHSACAVVFARYRIDYCCKGEMPLVEACAKLGLDPAQIAGELETAIARRTTAAPPDPRTLSTRDVIIKLIAPHHQYLHRTMPFLRVLSAKVARVHGDREPSLLEVAAQIEVLFSTLDAHLAEEEHDMFPALLAQRIDDARPMLRAMRSEHDAVGTMLSELRTACADYVAPVWACTSYRTLMSELENLEADTLTHVHLENHVLLPRFLDAGQA